MSDMQVKPGRKRSFWLILLIIVALAAAGAAGAAWWLLNQKNAATAEQEAPPPPEPVFMPLDTFTVNLVNADNDPDRVLYVGFTLRLPDEATRTRFTNYLPEVRSRLLLLLSRQDAIALANEQGKQKLIEQIKQVLSPPLVPGQPNQVVTDVLFTAFILR
ncbi:MULTISPECIES: flagellar basal body-associated protein FliL [Pectobacterium]|uniref:Flagellar protein FliL n=2 Tax=Pectobacterium TaxID=122277 RepID=A0AA93DN06_9GAMM|nr:MULTISPECIES: flagellar basal body-associated protein FliL [Pectobacterium]PLY36619.1 flagellar basal body-associated protein FliL [Pectobacterium carotovorum]MBE5203806.1 flagellar basal body-associated protein FliL [Pectobacterium quasiaquaticum]MBE5211282.1 flagellar basal body-associated protein FliL [Pectobacterium quasiaquaticum]MBE5214827.1 flagellar basal body-associated protein FliL [Pectobacterium quasiaquaticum]MBE5223012.1 flagellar basal body-associated protein FliL [Pectobacte